jgi:hypothetical protein
MLDMPQFLKIQHVFIATNATLADETSADF